MHVVYGLPSLKTHAKCILIIRREGDGVRHYVPIGTGNYHPKTARLYTDFGLLTVDEQIGADVADMFNFLTGYARPKRYRRVLVAPSGLRDGILAEAFQEALGRVTTDAPLRIFMYVRQELRREVFKALEEITAWEEVGFGTDADLEPDPSTVYAPPLIGVWLEGYGTLPEQAELLATLVDRGGLKALVHRRHGDLAVLRAVVESGGGREPGFERGGDEMLAQLPVDCLIGNPQRPAAAVERIAAALLILGLLKKTAEHCPSPSRRSRAGAIDHNRPGCRAYRPCR